ncbi:RNA-directed DNA polymerase, eukaryota, reverse transcriptase zinc-binding domain protein [Tanacetum coccineum]
MWTRFGFKEIINNGNGRWIFKFTRSGLGRTEYARVLVEIEAKKGLEEEIELQYRDKDQLKCSRRTKSVYEIAREAEEKSKKVEEVEFNVVQNRFRKPIRNTEYVRNSVCGNRKKKKRRIMEMKKGKQRYSVLEGINEDNYNEINMLKDKMLVDKYLDLKLQPNNGMEGIVEDVLKDYSFASRITIANAVLRGDFNVTFNVSEHSAGKSTIDGDMEDFLDCVNNIELEDKKKSFKFANFIANKGDFLPIVEKGWIMEVQGCHMFKLVKKLKVLKALLNKLHWKDGNVFNNVVKLRNKLKAAQIEINEDPYDNVKKVVASQILTNKMMQLMMRLSCFECNKVVNEFVNHFEMFLGQSSRVNSLDEIEDIFTSNMTTEEASFMIREVTDNENKTTIFGINDSKAPGPDGYTACFFKKAWNVIGTNVCKAVKEFFNNGKLLKEVNSTIIALISKVNHACNVTDYRFIACCNILYKCISKILTARIKKGFDKVEILRDILSKFGFHKKMVDWISTCVTSTSFSICLNGNLHGYFKGGWGLRQGDPISPYLFTLVIEVFTLILNNKIQHSHSFKYHSGCKEIMLTHLCFANDLLVLCYGDAKSVKVIKDALGLFSNISGLKPNMSKSTIFFGNVDIGEKNRILEIVPF